MLKRILPFIILVFLFSNCKKEEIRIKLATTTSTENSGLLAFLLPEFTKDSGIIVDTIAVGTGKALELGKNGDVDVVLVHARNLEDKFVDDGFGVNRTDVMYNDFIIAGAEKYKDLFNGTASIAECFKIISENGIDFISRGDNSGTHVKELEVWSKTDIKPHGNWYKEVGQGMEQVLGMTSNLQGVTLTDRGTYLAVKDKIELEILYQHDPLLSNPYGIIAVNPAKWEHVKFKEAMKLINWIVSDRGQKLINDFKVNGEQLFFTK